MARILFPSYFPIGNCVKSSEQQPFGPETYHNTEATMTQIMEIYWRVRKWKIENTFLGTSVERYNWPNLYQPPETEEKLVCGALSEFAPGYSYIGCSVNSPEAGSFGTILNGFLSIVGFTPAIYDINQIQKYYMGLYIELSYGPEDDPETFYSGFSYNPSLFFDGEFTIPIKLSETTIEVPMFYDTEYSLAATHFKIDAIEWWPYKDKNGNALYSTSTGQPL
jgi:hypothetical protein